MNFPTRTGLSKDDLPFAEWLAEISDFDEWIATLSGNPDADSTQTLWLDGPGDSTVGYDFEARSSWVEPGVSSLEAVKYIIAQGVCEMDRLWIDGFEGALRAWAAVENLRAMRDSVGLEAVMNHVEAWMRDKHTLEMNPEQPFLFDNQRVPCPFRTLLQKTLELGNEIEPTHVMGPEQPRNPPGMVAYSFEARRNADGSVSVYTSKHHSGGTQRLEIANYVNRTKEDWNGLTWDVDREVAPTSTEWNDYAWYRARADVTELENTRARLGLEAAQRLAENWGVANGFMDPNREDPRLFTEGGPDRFTSGCEYERGLHGRENDKSLRYAVERSTARGTDRKVRPAVNLVKYWEYDQYSEAVTIYIGEIDEDVDPIVMELNAMLFNPIYGVAAVFKLTEDWNVQHQRIRAKKFSFRFGPADPALEQEDEQRRLSEDETRSDLTQLVRDGWLK
jgi:hypothetical protein